MSTRPEVTTADGVSIEAEMVVPDRPVGAVVIAHPNPLMGGSMYTPVPGAFFRALEANDLAGIRFNFRGVGQSGGTHDKGVGEKLDLAAVIDVLVAAVPDVPLVLSGWSWGADLSLSCDDHRVAGWFVAAPPLMVFEPETMAARLAPVPKLMACPENDHLNPPRKCADATADWTNTTVVQIDSCDHFFGDALPALTSKFVAFASSLG